MSSLKDLIKELCGLSGVSGRERPVAEYIIKKLEGAEGVSCKTDNLGNIIVHKRGRRRPPLKIMLDAHMDEVGIMALSADQDGFLRFTTVGGVDPSVLLCRRVKFKNAAGVIGCRPVHLLKDGDRDKMPEIDDLYIDIGADSKEEAESLVHIGEEGVFLTEFTEFGDGLFLSRAIDDRAGCAVILKLLLEKAEFDFYASFTVQEEVGCRGAKTAAYKEEPDIAIVIEGTTAADIAGTPPEKTVCSLKGGPAVSFMDHSSVYDRRLYAVAFDMGVKCQPKAYVSGGNNSGAFAQSGAGARVMALSLPSRYIHSGSSAAAFEDLYGLCELAGKLIVYFNENSSEI